MMTYTRTLWMEPRFCRVVTGVLLLGYAVLVAVLMQRNEVGLDEPFSLCYSQLPIPQLINFLNTGNNPPLYELILHGLHSLGWSDLWVFRSFSLLCTLGSGLLLYRLAHNWFGRPWLALLALTFFLFNDYELYFAQEVRTYALLQLLVLAHVSVMQHLSDHPLASVWGWMLWTVVGILLGYTHYFGWLVMAMEAVWLLRLVPVLQRPRLWTSLGVLVLGLAPQAWVMVQRFWVEAHGTSWLAPPRWDSWFELVHHFSTRTWVAAIALLALALALVRAWLDRPLQPHSLGFLAWWFWLPLVGTFLVSFWMPVFHNRYLIIIAPAFYLSLVHGISKPFVPLPWLVRHLRWVLPALFVVGCHYRIDNTCRFREVSLDLHEYAPHMPVVVHPAWRALNLMYYQNPSSRGCGPAPDSLNPRIFAAYGPSDLTPLLQHDTLAYLFGEGQPNLEQEPIARALARTHRLTQVMHYKGRETLSIWVRTKP